MYAFSRSVVMQSSAQVVVLNPNSTQAVTDALDVSLERFRLGGGPNIVCETLAEGPPAIESDSHALQVVEPFATISRRMSRHRVLTSSPVSATPA